MILDLDKANILITSYFGLEKIDFTEDILDELGITCEWRIVKPNKDYELCKSFLKHRASNLSDIQRMTFSQKNKSDKKRQLIIKNAIRYGGRGEFLRSKNHGNR